LHSNGSVAGVQRKCAQCEEEDKDSSPLQRKDAGTAPGVAPPIVHQVLNSPGQPLDAGTRAFMEPRFGHDFSQVRVHTDDRARESASAVNALAYTVGHHLVFRDDYNPGTAEARGLIAHELVHTIQQRTAGAFVMRRYAHADCGGEPDDKWIDKVVVNQTERQKVTVHWKNKDGTDGGTEEDQCSTGKGHCCVAPGAGSGGTCSATTSKIDNTNCTPIGLDQHVVRHVRNHGGVQFWSEINTDRAVALHEYSPVDGTPLSHGCIRLNHDMAVKIFCGSVDRRTQVQVINVARPMCDHQALQDEWLADFALAATDPLPKDGELRREVLEARRELKDAFGKTRTPAQYGALTASDIPRCNLPAAPPVPQQSNTSGSVTDQKEK
jgi:uncharacterized protein DUF4157/L,D-transpeptidase-like protein